MQQTSSDFKNSSDESFKTICSDNNMKFNHLNNISVDLSSEEKLTNLPKNDPKVLEKSCGTMNSFEIPVDFPSNGFLYNAIYEKKSTYV